MEKLLTLAGLQDEADRLFSLLVRQDAANEIGIAKCSTCGKYHHWRKMQCGHYMSRRHKATRYERKNTAIQCVGCNMFNQGKQEEMGRYLDKTYGQGTADLMKMKKDNICHRGRFEWLYLINELKTELKQKGYDIR